jgi:UDP-N-acetylglucosamine kinase
MDKSEIEKEAIAYLKANMDQFYSTFLDGHEVLSEKIAFFTAGPSGAGKTEFVQGILNVESDLVHLDIDSVREFFFSIGYDGSNSDLFQKPSSYGVQYLFEEIINSRGYSFVLDSNLAKLQTASENFVKLLERGYKIELYYIYNDLETCYLYTKKREVITKRVVPEDVFIKNAIQSRVTVYELKKRFNDKIVLNVIDKKNSRQYENVGCGRFQEIVPVYV